MSFKLLLPLLLALLAAKIAAQTALTSSTASPRHGDILCRIEIPYQGEGERGEATIWTLPAIPDNSPDHLQAIRCIGDCSFIISTNQKELYTTA